MYVLACCVIDAHDEHISILIHLCNALYGIVTCSTPAFDDATRCGVVVHVRNLRFDIACHEGIE